MKDEENKDDEDENDDDDDDPNGGILMPVYELIKGLIPVWENIILLIYYISSLFYISFSVYYF